MTNHLDLSCGSLYLVIGVIGEPEIAFSDS